jgi:hypothetical protein
MDATVSVALSTLLNIITSLTVKTPKIYRLRMPINPVSIKNPRSAPTIPKKPMSPKN